MQILSNCVDYFRFKFEFYAIFLPNFTQFLYDFYNLCIITITITIKFYPGMKPSLPFKAQIILHDSIQL